MMQAVVQHEVLSLHDSVYQPVQSGIGECMSGHCQEGQYPHVFHTVLNGGAMVVLW